VLHFIVESALEELTNKKEKYESLFKDFKKFLTRERDQVLIEKHFE